MTKKMCEPKKESEGMCEFVLKNVSFSFDDHDDGDYNWLKKI